MITRLLGRYYIDIDKISSGIIVDAGACYGEIINSIREYVPNKIIGIEPNISNIKYLKTCNFENIHLIEAALVSEIWTEKKIKFYEFMISPGWSNITGLNLGTPRAKAKGAVKTYFVNIIKLSNIINEYGFIDYLKLDIEGAEFDVLLNFPESLFKYINQLSAEVHYPYRIGELSKCLTDHDYDIIVNKNGIEIYAIKQTIDCNSS